MPRPRTIAALAGVGLVLFLAAGLLFSPYRVLLFDPADGDPVRGVSTVVVDDNEFATPVIEVAAGTTVTWQFQDTDNGQRVAHNVTADDFRSPDIQAGRYKRTFTKPGNYRYRCNLHFAMRGRVDVTER